MAAKLPWMKFFVSDWMTDTALAKCTPSTRGVWIELLCAMHHDGETGEVSGTIAQLSKISRCSEADMADAIDDLTRTCAADVTKRNGFVTIINRRMKQEFNSRNSNKIRVAKHRNAKATSEVMPNVTPCNGIESESDIESDTETEEKKTEFCAEVQKTAPPAPPANDADEFGILEFPVVGKTKSWWLTKPLYDKLNIAFPDDVTMTELKRIRLWLESHPQNKKTERGMMAFLFRWFSGNRDRGRGSPSAQKSLLQSVPLIPETQVVKMGTFGGAQEQEIDHVTPAIPGGSGHMPTRVGM